MNIEIKDSGLIITIIFSIITIILTIYIAHRQGILKSPKLSATVGTYGTLGTQIWSMVIGIKNLNKEYYLVLVPYIIENRGDVALKNILIQFFYKKDFDSSIFKVFDTDLHDDNKILNYDINRIVKHVQNTILVEYQIPFIAPKSPVYLQEPILIKKSEFHKIKTKFEKKMLYKSVEDEYIIEKLKCSITAENHKPFELNTWLIITYADNFYELTERTEWPTWKLFYHSCPKFLGHLYVRRTELWAQLAPPIFPYCKKFLFYMQPNFVILKEGGKIAALQIHDNTEMKLAVYDMSYFQPIKT